VSHTPEPPGQEPGSDADILKFTKEKYAVTFPVFSKLLVNGPQASDLYKWLKAETPKDSSSSSADIRWNFTKVRSPYDVPRRLRVA
jgi:glutathione peroxidase